MREAWRWLPVFRDKKIKICRDVSLFLLVEKKIIFPNFFVEISILHFHFVMFPLISYNNLKHLITRFYFVHFCLSRSPE